MARRRLKRVGTIVIALLIAWAAVMSWRDQTYFQPEIEQNVALKAAAVEHIRELQQKAFLHDWYCSAVTIPNRRSIFDVAPDCEFAQLILRQRWWRRATFPYPPARLLVYVALRKSDGRHRTVGNPLCDWKRFPDFLVWAGARITSEEDAVKAVQVVYMTHDSPTNADVFIACRDDQGVWSVASRENGCLQPTYKFRTDKQGFVTGGDYFTPPMPDRTPEKPRPTLR